jgi:large subunit ribosomal protein L31
MKPDIHPQYHLTTISCTCGAVYETYSTEKDLKIGICARCHPFFTGEQRFVDTAGRVEKFQKRFGAATVRRRKPKLGATAEPAAVSV